jgi:hypothetical protein
MARRFSDPLKNVQVASPCVADWDLMIGTDRIRFCGRCSLNVYNLSCMTRNDAESLILRNEGRLCVRFYRRPDGSIITQDCPVGLAAIRRKMSYLTKALFAAGLAFLASFGLHNAFPAAPEITMGTVALNMGKVAAPDPKPVFGELVMPVSKKRRR